MSRFATCIWLNDQAEAAFDFYKSVFKNVELLRSAKNSESNAKMTGAEVGSVMTLECNIEGLHFLLLNGGPMFQPNPSISFFIGCADEAEIDETFKKLSEGGSVLMPLDKYPFSEKFAWVNDKYGVSWQMNLQKRSQKITPALMFVGEQAGRAEEAMKRYTEIFDNSKIVEVSKYVEGDGDKVGLVKHGVFELEGEQFIALDSTMPHKFGFNEGVSLIIHCDDQADVDNFWKKLTEGGKPSQCGWLIDKFGVSWQVVPNILVEMLQEKDPERYEKFMKALMQMQKLDIKELETACKS